MYFCHIKGGYLKRTGSLCFWSFMVASKSTHQLENPRFEPYSSPHPPHSHPLSPNPLQIPISLIKLNQINSIHTLSTLSTISHFPHQHSFPPRYTQSFIQIHPHHSQQTIHNYFQSHLTFPKTMIYLTHKLNQINQATNKERSPNDTTTN